MPDTAGLSFWTDALAAGASLDTITQNFLTAPEGVATYSPFATGEDFVADFYQTVFGRAADEDGLTFWTNALEGFGGAASTEARAKLVAAIVEIVSTPLDTQPEGMSDDDYAQTVEDRATFANRVAVGEYYGVSLNTDVTTAQSSDLALSQVTDAIASVEALKAKAFGEISSGSAAISGTSGDDVFTVNDGGFSGTIDGRGGNDTLNVDNIDEVTEGKYKNIEKINLSGLTSTIDASLFAGATSVNIGNTNSATVTGVEGVTLGVNGRTTGQVTVEYAEDTTAASIVLDTRAVAGQGGNLELTGAKLASLSLTGTGAVNVMGDTVDTLKTINVSTSTDVLLGVSTLEALTLVHASASTGDVSVSINANAAYKGGSGVDTLELSVANNNAIDGGAGDTDVVYARTAAALNGSTKITGFEILNLSMGEDSYDSGLVTDALTYNGKGFKSIALSGGVDVAVKNVDAGTTLDFTGSADVVYTLANADGTSDALTINLTNQSYLNAGVQAAGVESITVNVDGPVREEGEVFVFASDGTDLDLGAAAAASIVIKGEGDFTLNAQNAGLGNVTLVDATGLTAGTFSFSSDNDTLGANVTIKGALVGENNIQGGDANDTITGGAGDDNITSGTGLDVVTGGAGADTFTLSANANSQVYTTIADFDQTDVIELDSLVQLKDAPELTHLTLAGTATLNDYISAAVNKAVAGATPAADVSAVSWFNFGGDTYIVVDNNAAATSFVNGEIGGDQIVKLTGTIDLSSVNYAEEQLSFADLDGGPSHP